MKAGAGGWGLLLSCWLAGCATVLEPPHLDGDAEPVHLLDHGRHTSLVLPDGKGGAVRYAYGDWTWFAEGDTGFLQAIRALLWPTDAALGRQPLDAWGSSAELERQIPESFAELLTFDVSATDVRRLARRLDSLHEAGRDQALHNPDFGLSFVPHPERYWFFNSSNTMMGRWLEALGVEVRGSAWFSIWRISPPERPR